MTVQSEAAVKGDSNDFYVVRKWNNGASNTDTRERRIIVKFLPGAESNCFRFITIKCKTIVEEAGVKFGKANLELAETGLEGVCKGWKE